MKNRITSLVKFLIGWPLSFLAFVFILRLIAPQTSYLLSHIKYINWQFLLYGIGCFLAFYYIRGYIWHLLLAYRGYTLQFRESCYLWATSELKRYIPGNIWAFLGRAVLFNEKKINKKDIAICLVLEQEIFVIGAVIIALLSLPFWAHFYFHGITHQYMIVLSLLVALLAVCYIFIGRQLPKDGHWKFIRFLLSDYHPKQTFMFLCLSATAIFLFGFAYYFTISAVATLPLQLIWELIGFFVFSFLAGYLSFLTPAGFGVREGIIIVGLTKFFSESLCAFLALLSRVVLIISELIFITFTWILYKTKNKFVLYAQDLLYSHKEEAILGGLIIIYLLYFTTISFLRYDNFYTGRFDLGNMAQTVWNTMHGRIFTFTNPNGTSPISRLAFHADFLLILLAPLYLLWTDPRNLLFIQTVVLSAGAIFVYLIAKDMLKNKSFAVLFAFIYLLNPSIERTNLYDFHAITLATTFFLAAFYFVRQKRYAWFLLFAILAGLCKEELWLITGLFGMYIFLLQRKQKFMFRFSNPQILGGLVFFVSLAIFYYLIWYAIPQNLGSQHFALSYYSDFGNKPASVIKSVLLSPEKVLGIILQRERLLYLNQLFAPLGYLPFLAPWILIFAIPELLINLLSNNAQTYQIYYQYTAAISPFLFIATIYGIYMVKKILPDFPSIILLCYLFVITLFFAYMYGPLPGTKEQNIDMMTKPVVNQQFINNYLSHIPKRLSVAASNNIGSHLSQRQQIYTLPLGYNKADLIVFLLNPNSEPATSLAAERKIVKKMKNNPKLYQLLIEKDQFLVFRRV